MKDSTEKECPKCRSIGNFLVFETHDITGCVEIRQGKVVGRNWDPDQPSKISTSVKCLECGHVYTPRNFNWSDFPDGKGSDSGFVDGRLNDQHANKIRTTKEQQQ